MRERSLIQGTILTAVLLASAPAAAQDAAKTDVKKEYVDVKIAAPEKDHEGLEISIKAGATMSINDSRSVLGQPDGLGFTFGIKFDGAAIYQRNDHEWRTGVTMNQMLSRTPAIPEFIKTADVFGLESTYLFFYRPWVGPFVRYTLSTPLFRSFDVRPVPTTYRVTRPDGTAYTLESQRLTLAEPLRPMTMKESIGPFLRPLDKEQINMEIRAGLGALQTLAAGSFAIKDDAKTPEVEVNELKDIFQLGLEASFEIWGMLLEKRISYKVATGLLIPSARSAQEAGDTRSALELTNVEFGAALSFRLVEWATLDYELRVLRQPQLTEALQVRNGMMLTLGLGYTNKPPPPTVKAAAPPEKPATTR
ncbi:hypothetical protein [Polyangium aurulentum]|uniref:hypothetical protein n=1 Tax=Polyangium aurulentum TaxID=2567896 RepID=UPI0010AEA61C|nr:hypothetical protein [Polyangium aurulentum]UQA62770.1 hypothetical protein E8A73_020895 [Polyangium aurulentum]